MYSFKNDYSEGCHPRILEALTRTNPNQTVGYGLDEYCAHAAQLIRSAASCPNAAIHFLVGGTQTNQTSISAFLRPHEAAVAAVTGHIAVHETGAIEATGHKVITVDTPDGKLTPALCTPVLEAHMDEHMVLPKLLYVSDSTELGTVYTKAELCALSDFCRASGLYLYLDGARLASALTAPENDLTLPDLAHFCDAFYIGGTKNGALFGEALVIVNDQLKPGFRHLIKQHGGMLAKGRLLGIQFEALFTEDLYFQLGRHSNDMAAKLRAGLSALGYPPVPPVSCTNQAFHAFPTDFLAKLDTICLYESFSKVDTGHTSVRLVTSWATPERAVDDFLAALSRL